MMDRFELKEMEKERPIKNTWYDWLINYVSRPIRKTVGGFKDKVKSLRQRHLRNTANKLGIGAETN